MRFKDPVSEWPLEGRGLLVLLNLWGLGPWGLTSIPLRSLSWLPLENECGLCSDGGWREKAALSQGFENNSPCLWPSGSCLVDGLSRNLGLNIEQMDINLFFKEGKLIVIEWKLYVLNMLFSVVLPKSGEADDNNK